MKAKHHEQESFQPRKYHTVSAQKKARIKTFDAELNCEFYPLIEDFLAWFLSHEKLLLASFFFFAKTFRKRGPVPPMSYSLQRFTKYSARSVQTSHVNIVFIHITSILEWQNRDEIMFSITTECRLTREFWRTWLIDWRQGIISVLFRFVQFMWQMSFFSKFINWFVFVIYVYLGFYICLVNLFIAFCTEPFFLLC